MSLLREWTPEDEYDVNLPEFVWSDFDSQPQFLTVAIPQCTVDSLRLSRPTPCSTALNRAV